MKFKLLCGPACSNPTIHRSGESAWLDTHAGLVPVKVSFVEQPGDGWVCCSGSIRVVVKRTTGAWPKGHIVSFAAPYIVPHDKLVTRGLHYRIQTNYRWE